MLMIQCEVKSREVVVRPALWMVQDQGPWGGIGSKDNPQPFKKYGQNAPQAGAFQKPTVLTRIGGEALGSLVSRLINRQHRAN
jgi:hypothetical protein